MAETVYTIGHSTHSIVRFIELLKSQSITAVCDVRSQPYSRVNSQFNRESLQQALRMVEIKYVFLGRELGARTEDRTCYRNGQVQYDLLAQTGPFRNGIERVKEGSRSYCVALMCAEREPLDCHRTILVSRKLFEEGLPIKHILGDGRVEEHKHAIDRLIAKLRINERDMFRSIDAVITEAYSRQGNEIAYREPTPDSPTSGRTPLKSISDSAR